MEIEFQAIVSVTKVLLLRVTGENSKACVAAARREAIDLAKAGGGEVIDTHVERCIPADDVEESSEAA